MEKLRPSSPSWENDCAADARFEFNEALRESACLVMIGPSALTIVDRRLGCNASLVERQSRGRTGTSRLQPKSRTQKNIGERPAGFFG